MAVWDWFLSLFDRNTKTLDISTIVGEIATEIYFKELAVQACINLIAGVLSRAEFQTFEKGEEVRKDSYYLFNVEPNPNKSASKFWRDVVSKMVYNNECLVVWQDEHIYVADNFSVDRYAFKEYIYRNVIVDDFALSRSYTESEVFHFELHNERIADVIEGLYNSYGKLIAAAQVNYKRNHSRRGTVEVPTNWPTTEKAQQELRDLFERKFKAFFEAEGPAVLPLTGGLKYNELPSNIGVKGGADNAQIRAFIDDVIDFVCIAFQVPPQLIKGDVADTEKAMDNLLTFCINPLAEVIHDEINRKYYKKKAVLERTYMRINTSMIRAHDLKDIAGALETLLRIGGYSIDDILKTLGMEPLGTEWSTARWMTKNYEPVEQFFSGGDDSSVSQ